MLTIRFERGNVARTFPIRLYEKRHDPYDPESPAHSAMDRVTLRYITEDDLENTTYIGIGERNEWDDAYVMNESGKTIDHIRP